VLDSGERLTPPRRHVSIGEGLPPVEVQFNCSAFPSVRSSDEVIFGWIVGTPGGTEIKRMDNTLIKLIKNKY